MNLDKVMNNITYVVEVGDEVVFMYGTPNRLHNRLHTIAEISGSGSRRTYNLAFNGKVEVYNTRIDSFYLSDRCLRHKRLEELGI